MENQSLISGFVLLEFSDIRELQILHFVLFLTFYLVIVTGNLLIITAVAFDHHLHTPMYFFLLNLAVQDLGYVSVMIPKSMANSLLNTRHISYAGCFAQVLFFILFSGCDICLLTVMAYDRYIAICNPLQYAQIMNKQACIHMVIASWISSLINGLLHASGTFAKPFCSNIVNQFFCEIPKVLKLACSGMNLTEIGMVTLSCTIVLGCFIFMMITYANIFAAVRKIHSVEGRRKAFSTCLPHITVVSVFVSTGIVAYLRPPSDSSFHLDLAVAIIYCFVPPLFNPIIYSLRSKDIRNALSKSCAVLFRMI